jgi:hypothetical protein
MSQGSGEPECSLCRHFGITFSLAVGAWVSARNAPGGGSQMTAPFSLETARWSLP